MFKELKFAIYAIKKNIQSSAELRISFLMNIFGMAVNNTAFVLIWVFFIKSVGVIGGWTAIDIIGLQGFAAISFGIIFSVAAGIRKIPEYVMSGAFDRYMLSPKNLLLRVSVANFGVSAVGDIFFGIICLIVFICMSHLGIIQIMFLIMFIILSSVIFFAVSVVVFSLSFYFIDGDIITDGVFQFFFTPALFHGGAFQGGMRFIFTFLVPSLLIGALPVEIIKSISMKGILFVFVLAFLWLYFSIILFNKAVKKYESANFMTFGQ